MQTRALLSVCASLSLLAACPVAAPTVVCLSDGDCRDGYRCSASSGSCVAASDAGGPIYDAGGTPNSDGGAIANDSGALADDGGAIANDSGAPSEDAGGDAAVDAGEDNADSGAVGDGGPFDDDGGFFCLPGAPSCTSLIDFTPGLAKRAPGGAMTVGVLVQGDPVAPAASNSDVLSFPPGAVIGGPFAAHADTGQGTIAVWVTLETDASDLTGDVTLFRASGVRAVLTSGGHVVVALEGAGTYLAPDLADAFVAGTPSLLVVRWDRRQAFAAGGHVILDTAAGRVVASDVGSTPPAPSEGRVGNSASAGAANAVLGGLFVLRRPLYDGTSGIDLGRGDEVSPLFAGADLSEVIGGSFDVLYALPTNQQPGPLGVSLEAWSHPHTKNVLGNDAFFLDVPSVAVWIPTANASVSSPSANHSLFGGSIVVTGDSADDYLERGLDEDVAGRSFVLRVLAHERSREPVVHVVIERAGEAEAITYRLSQSSGSTRAQPAEFTLSFDLPADATRLAIRLSTSGAGEAVFHQVELYDNLLLNPSFESWPVEAGVPVDWQVQESLPPDTFFPEATLVKGGARSLHVLADLNSSNQLDVRQAPLGMIDHHFYVGGGFFRWASGDEASIHVSNGSLFDEREPYGSSNKLHIDAPPVPDVWNRIGGVGRRLKDSQHNNHFDFFRFGIGWGDTANVYVDDVWAIALDHPPLLHTPADVVASTSRNRLRVDGADVATQALSVVTASEGSILARVIFGREGANAVGCGANVTYLVAENALGEQLRFGAVGQQPALELQRWSDPTPLDDAGGAMTTLTVFGEPDSRPPEGTLVEVALSWQYPGDAVVLVDGVERVRVEMPAPFAAAPSLLTFGAAPTDARRCDMAVTLPGALEERP